MHTSDPAATKKDQTANRLINETSPYLLQHAHNPVDWYPWGEQAFTRARNENKPIFLSIGYAACHWCHVMEHESFENKEIAAYVNDHFISIKVDREERPDIDNIYMTAVQLLTGSGGWPLSAFLTPDLKPFYGGTYFPPEDKYGRIGFKSLLRKLVDTWHNEHHRITQSSEAITAALAQYENQQKSIGATVPKDILEQAVEDLSGSFDPEWGGFGGAPKFPQSMAIAALLRTYRQTGNKKHLLAATITLDKMAQGGMYDHLGGGFHRYSTDREWLVPHFEKMLYDNALLTDAYLEAYQLTHTPAYREVAAEVLAYVLDDMVDESGAFHSTRDADNAGQEGMYYVWTQAEIMSILGEKEGGLFCELYNINEQGNFASHEAYHTAQNILHLSGPKRAFAERKGIPWNEFAARLAEWKGALLEVRSRRIAPAKDDKIIVAWNGLMISTCAHGYQVLGDKRYLAAALRASQFISTRMMEGDHLLRIARNDTRKVPAFLDDYAHFANACVDVYEASFEVKWLELARRLTDRMIADFRDEADHGFFYTATHHTDLLNRSKSWYDGATPAGNSIAAYVLLRLAKLLDKKEYLLCAEQTINANAGGITKIPQGHLAMIRSIDFLRSPPAEIALAGGIGQSNLQKLLNSVHAQFIPNKVLAHIDPQEESARRTQELIPLLAAKSLHNGKPAVYVCRNFACKAPVTEPDQLNELLAHESNTM
ncbi:MAG: DUF255 domain-containing protein [Chitinivibrionales bacterium]|nr:DUF255 domain-containing protein [Chitinivibrionales bacterium]